MTNLLERLRAREERAQNELRIRLFPKVLATCARMLEDPVRAEEVAEDIWMDFVFNYIDRVREEAAVASYLKLMTVRRCIRSREFLSQHQELTNGALSTGHAEGGMVERLDADRERLRLRRCMQKLSQRHRSILRMRYHHDMTLEKIGQTQGFTKQHAGQLVAEGIRQLKRCMQVRT